MYATKAIDRGSRQATRTHTRTHARTHAHSHTHTHTHTHSTSTKRPYHWHQPGPTIQNRRHTVHTTSTAHPHHTYEMARGPKIAQLRSSPRLNKPESGMTMEKVAQPATVLQIVYSPSFTAREVSRKAVSIQT